MYSKEESKKLTKEFWLLFDVYTQFFAKQKRTQVRWLLYKTGIKGLELKFETANQVIGVWLEINHKSEERRFELFVDLDTYRNIINREFSDELTWFEECVTVEGKKVSRIGIELKGVQFFNKDHWPGIFKFMAENMFRLQTNLNEILPLLKKQDTF